MAIRVKVEEDFCEGIGFCERICPAVFRVDPDLRKSVVLQPDVTESELIEQVELAETTCPTRAIVVEEILARKDG